MISSPVPGVTDGHEIQLRCRVCVGGITGTVKENGIGGLERSGSRSHRGPVSPPGRTRLTPVRDLSPLRLADRRNLTWTWGNFKIRPTVVPDKERPRPRGRTVEVKDAMNSRKRER